MYSFQPSYRGFLLNLDLSLPRERPFSSLSSTYCSFFSSFFFFFFCSSLFSSFFLDIDSSTTVDAFSFSVSTVVAETEEVGEVEEVGRVGEAVEEVGVRREVVVGVTGVVEMVGEVAEDGFSSSSLGEEDTRVDARGPSPRPEGTEGRSPASPFDEPVPVSRGEEGEVGGRGGALREAFCQGGTGGFRGGRTSYRPSNNTDTTHGRGGHSSSVGPLNTYFWGGLGVSTSRVDRTLEGNGGGVDKGSSVVVRGEVVHGVEEVDGVKVRDSSLPGRIPLGVKRPGVTGPSTGEEGVGEVEGAGGGVGDEDGGGGPPGMRKPGESNGVRFGWTSRCLATNEEEENPEDFGDSVSEEDGY